MDLWEAVWKSGILGAVQGLTEFLPVSSSGHLTFLQIIGLNFGEGMTTFINVMMHLGTLIAVIAVFWRDILALFKKPFKTLLMLIVATIPAGVVGLLFNDEIDAFFSGPTALLNLAVCFAVTGLLLLVAELVAKRRQKQPHALGWGSSISMGLMQAVALFPGISRSGSTIVAGTLTGAKREDVAKFSFLMSIPVILGSFAVEVVCVVREPSAVAQIGTNGFIGIAIGVVLAAVFGFLAIRLMLRAIRKANYIWFSVYLVCLSLTCFWLNALGIFPVAA